MKCEPWGGGIPLINISVVFSTVFVIGSLYMYLCRYINLKINKSPADFLKRSTFRFKWKYLKIVWRTWILAHHNSTSPQIGSGRDSKPLKHSGGLKCDGRDKTVVSKSWKMVILHGLKCKLGPKCSENIWKLANAPRFYNTASPQVGSALGSKPYKHSIWLQIWSQEYSKAESTAIEWFKCKLGFSGTPQALRLSLVETVNL